MQSFTRENLTLVKNMVKVIEYKIYCITEKAVITGLTYAPLTPRCPHDEKHHVRPETLLKIREINEKTVEIKEDTIETGGNFQVRSYEIDVPGGVDGTTGVDIKFDIPISIKNVGYLAHQDLVGDYIDGYVIPNYKQEGLIGFLTQPAQAGTTSLHLNREACAVLSPLFRLILNDGHKPHDIGEVRSIDKEEGVVEIYTPLPQDFKAGTAVQLIVHRIRKYYLHDQQMTPMGESTVKGSALPPSMGARVVYTNRNGQPKKFHFYAEIRY